MRILLGCERSQVVCKAFRDRGHEAFSCDILPGEGGHPEWHIQDNVLNQLDKGWDAAIFFPECRYLAFSGERWMKERPERLKLRQDAFDFFMKFTSVAISRVCIENSHSVFLTSNYKRPTQRVQPWMFGEPYIKEASLWLKNLPLLKPTSIVPVEYRKALAHMMPGGKDQAKKRSVFLPGVAKAMAEQWG
jgi:hypothetical protein